MTIIALQGFKLIEGLEQRDKTFLSINSEEFCSQDLSNFPLKLNSEDQTDYLEIPSEKELKFYFFLLLNTCHNCFPETKYIKKKKKFKLKVLPEEIIREENLLLPKSPIKKKNPFRNTWFSAKSKKSQKTLLDDVPIELHDSSYEPSLPNDHYMDSDIMRGKLIVKKESN